MTARLFAPITIRGVTLRNRVVISPMCQYSASDGLANDWHFVHLGRFAIGGAGLVIAEATAVSPEGRITHGDTGLWNDAQIEPFARVVRFGKEHGAAAGVQLAHAGRKASSQRPWFGNGPLTPADAAMGEVAWQAVSASALPVNADYPAPAALDEAGIARIVDSFRDAAARALKAGFDMIELHSAHGYLLHQFLSPLSNTRNDGYGGDREGRMRLPLDVVRAIRSVWPQDKPLFVRVSAVDHVEGGLTIEDSIAYAKALRPLGVDVIDCSAGGIQGSAATRIPSGYGFQVPYAEQIRREARMPTQAVGLVVDPHQAEEILAQGRADLIAIAREALRNPNWALHAREALEPAAAESLTQWPKQSDSWLARRKTILEKLGPYPGVRAS
jgi:2,4-dienoyl-CoA reductase-like NADH-dependent reductase (Old Yellow Enzyme family)